MLSLIPVPLLFFDADCKKVSYYNEATNKAFLTNANQEGDQEKLLNDMVLGFQYMKQQTSSLSLNEVDHSMREYSFKSIITQKQPEI